MSKKPTYEELEQRVRKLESAKAEHENMLEDAQQREIWYRNIFNNMLHEVHVWKLVFDDYDNIKTWKLMDANPSALKAWNRSLSEVVGKTPDEMFPNSGATEQFMPIVEKIFTEGTPHTWESFFEDTNQTLHMVSIPLDEYFISTGLDISESKQAEALLEESEERFRLAMKFSNDGLFDWNLVTNEIYYSPVWKSLLGYEDEELPNDFSIWETLTHADDIEKSWIMQKELINRKRNKFEIELRMKHKNGHWVDILSRANALFDENGKAVRILGTHVDISDRKGAEEALQKNEQKYRNLIQTASDGIYLASESGRYIDVNPAACSMLNRSREEILNLHVSDIDPNFSIEAFQEFWKEKPLGEPSIFETTHLHKDGSLVPIELSGQKFQVGEDVFCFGIARNISDRKKAEAERLELQTILMQAQKMEAIGTLAGGIAHDFNNILGAILGYAEMVQEDCPSGSTMKHDIDRVVEASYRAKGLVKQILTFSRQTETTEQALQPSLIIKEAVKMLRASLPTTIDIQLNIDPEAGLILADPTQIHQILTNLCTNALHAMEESGGTLTISLKNRELIPADLVSEPNVEPGLFVEISVSDTGPGISPQILDKIFDPFFTTKEIGKGTGMGLAIIHGIAKKSGGFVSCKSSPGEGATFHVYFPVHAVTAPPEAETAPLELVQAGFERILFIDDEEMLAEMGKAMLERLGYRVTVETNSIEALKTIQKHPDQFDLVITDQTMPGMTGSDLARRILQIRPELPIILCTGFSNQISEEKARIYGIKGFAMKPLAKKDLASLIRKVMDGEK